MPAPSARPLVLVVEDESDIREALAAFLADEGYQVRTARDGREALDVAAAEPPDVVLSDVMMPRLGGLELVRRLRAQGLTAPVVLISANIAGMDLPGVRFLAKPFDLGHLLDEVGRTLAGG